MAVAAAVLLWPTHKVLLAHEELSVSRSCLYVSPSMITLTLLLCQIVVKTGNVNYSQGTIPLLLGGEEVQT